MARVVRNMTDDDIQAVCQIIDGWSGDTLLTWDALIQAIEKRLFKAWSRQALPRHEKIKTAYTLKKKFLRRSSPDANEENLPSDLRKALETIRRLKSENERISKENNDLMEQFRVWSYNANAKGVTEDVLNSALPRVQHGSSRDER